MHKDPQKVLHYKIKKDIRKHATIMDGEYKKMFEETSQRKTPIKGVIDEESISNKLSKEDNDENQDEGGTPREERKSYMHKVTHTTLKKNSNGISPLSSQRNEQDSIHGGSLTKSIRNISESPKRLIHNDRDKSEESNKVSNPNPNNVRTKRGSKKLNSDLEFAQSNISYKANQTFRSKHSNTVTKRQDEEAVFEPKNQSLSPLRDDASDKMSTRYGKMKDQHENVSKNNDIKVSNQVNIML